MKRAVFILSVIALAAYSCGPASTVVVSPVEPAVQIPPKPQDTPVAKTDAAPLTGEDMAAGKSLYENKCNRCHRLYAAKEYSKKEWEPIIKRMQIKSNIDDVQTASIYNYIVSQL